jgi:pimeloyl-ACP methyl ester carboxylesterase
MRRWIWPLLAVSTIAALGLVFWLSGRSESWRSPSGQSHFASCTYGGYVNGWCAHLRVAEDPRKPNGSMISLRIAVLPATKRPAAGALFYLEGGPGGAATAAAIRVNALFARVQRNRDLVMVDQRGTGGSRRLACPNGYVRGTDMTAVTGYLRRCLAGLDADPRLYTTVWPQTTWRSCVARWVREDRSLRWLLRRTLAQAYARRYPKSVAASFSTAPRFQMSGSTISARNAERALEAQLARCASSPACARAYPHPRRQLDQLLARPPRLVALPNGKVLMAPTTSPGRWTGYPRRSRTRHSFRSR